ncbi:MAG: TatD family hydrolase [Treponema sp.]|jgi:TatD DNase family protein|nr:TatD family hydrolase [Treponema sp.]
MLTDAHCHPQDLSRVYNEFEKERLSVKAAASACDMEEFSFNEKMAHNTASCNTLLLCFAAHPQLAAKFPAPRTGMETMLQTLDTLAAQGHIAAVGEFGFDLYNAAFRETEAIQDTIFASQLETALRYSLPVILHVRRAMHKIFAASKTLAKCKAVVFHSWPGAYEEARSLLGRGVNAWFSFGNAILLNHKQAQRSCALLPADRLLTETDAPYQPRRGQKYSHWHDLPLILQAASSLRGEAGNSIDMKDMESLIETNFYNAFGK